MKGLLPAPVYGAIEAHLTQRAQDAPEGWEGGSDEEDTLTGDLRKTFRTQRSSPIATNGDTWSWTYGLRGVHYEAICGLLIVPDGTAYRVSLAHRIMIEASRR